jgi:hypothetical protein
MTDNPIIPTRTKVRLQLLKDVHALGDKIARPVLREATFMLVEAIQTEFLGHLGSFRTHLIAPNVGTLIEITTWMVKRAEAGELERPGAIRQ